MSWARLEQFDRGRLRHTCTRVEASRSRCGGRCWNVRNQQEEVSTARRHPDGDGRPWRRRAPVALRVRAARMVKFSPSSDCMDGCDPSSRPVLARTNDRQGNRCPTQQPVRMGGPGDDDGGPWTTTAEMNEPASWKHQVFERIEDDDDTPEEMDPKSRPSARDSPPSATGFGGVLSSH